MQFKGMRHLALTVDDVEASTRFYREAFGMRAFGPSKHDERVVPLVSPAMRDQITLRSTESGPEAVGASGPPGSQGGIDHFGFIVSSRSSLQNVRAHLESCGATFVAHADVAPRVPSMFFRDPDGYLFQVTRFPFLTRLYVWLLPLLARLRARRAAHGAA